MVHEPSGAPGGVPGGSSGAAIPFWRDVRVLAIFSQLFFLAIVLLIGGYLLSNLTSNMETKGFAPRLDWLGLRAGYTISESVIPYTPDDTYARALTVGLLNTLMVSAVGILFATILGLIIGVARLSRNWLVNRLALAYVEIFRNTPLLVQLLVIYFFVFLEMPKISDAIALPLEM